MSANTLFEIKVHLHDKLNLILFSSKDILMLLIGHLTQSDPYTYHVGLIVNILGKMKKDNCATLD